MSPLFKRIPFILFLLSLSLVVEAQIGVSSKAKDLLKDKKEKSSEKTSESRSEAPEKTSRESPAARSEDRSSPSPARSKPSMSDKYKASDVELDFESEPFAPAIAWSSLLSEGCWYFNITNGEMKLNNLEVSFLPKKTKSGKDVRYESYSNTTPLLRMEVVDSKSNSIVQTMHYEAKLATAPFYDMELLEGYDYKTHATLKEGSYELRFWAGTKQFYTFPFQVEKQSNPDPYAPVHDFYFLKGPWQDWGRVEFGPDGHFIFNFYATHESTTVPNAARWDVSKEYKYLMKLYRDGKIVAVHRLQNVENQFDEGDLQTRNGVWKKYDGTFHLYPVLKKGTGAGSREFFMKNNMQDGNYTVEVWLKDKEGKESTQKYGFVVKNKAIVPAAKADRSQNGDALQFLEQGPNLFYVKKL